MQDTQMESAGQQVIGMSEVYLGSIASFPSMETCLCLPPIATDSRTSWIGSFVLPMGRHVPRLHFCICESRTKYRIMWLVLDRSGIEVCGKDHGSLSIWSFRGPIADFVAVHLGVT